MKILSFILLAVFMFVSTAHAQKWVRLAEFPEPTEELLGASADGKLYVFCGLAPGWKPMGLVYEYDPATDMWTKKKPMPLASHHVSFSEYRGKIYVIGGRVGAAGITTASNTNVVEQYDPGTDSWGGVRARMPTPRSAMASGVYGGRIYVTGGEFQDSQMMATFRALEAYDPASNTWSVLPPMPVARHGLAGAVVGNRLHMVSGDVQSAGTGVHAHAPYHDAFELGK